MFERGSEWRKWDLHIHTPNTKLNDNFKNDWDGFLNKIANSDIEVFGITDYFSFDNFTKLHDKINELKTNNKILYNKLSKKVFLINIELRLEITDHNNKNVNLHIIFNNKMKNINNQITTFFTRLRKNSQNGAFFNLNINYNTDFTTIEDIKNALSDSNINKKDYLIVGQMNGYGSCRECSDKESRKSKSLKNVRDFCDLFFGKEDNNKYTVEYYKKPTLFCSDAHSIDDLCIYNEEKIKGYTWIKADPTFDGLKQILYEYNDRVKIQELKPDEKSDFNLIDSIIILNKDDMKEEEKIIKEDKIEIKFNENLTSIIGEKSSGKSFLLFLIAKALLRENNSDELFSLLYNENNTNILMEKYQELINKINFYVKYKNGNEFNLDSCNTKKIRYIPQGCLNKSVENIDNLNKTKNYLLNIIKTKNIELNEEQKNIMIF